MGFEIPLVAFALLGVGALLMGAWSYVSKWYRRRED